MTGARERRCVVTGETGDPAGMIRFVTGPDGALVPDLAGKLPGRGLWVSARREVLERGVSKKLPGRRRGAGGPGAPAAGFEAGLADRLEDLLARRALSLLGLARRAGKLVTGFEKVRAALRSGEVAVLIEARDGARDGIEKLGRGAKDTPRVALFERDDLSLALGRGNVVHAALLACPLADRFLVEARRLAGFRSEVTSTAGPTVGN
jgi:predicted RNA-binding protein YlxR (DUF448 family)